MAPSRPSKWVNIGRAGVVGLEMAGSVVVPLFVGDYLDRRLGTSPWLMVVFVLAGMVAGVLRVVKEFSGSNGEQ